MSLISSDLISSMQTALELPALALVTRAEWSSEKADHRKLVRKALEKHILENCGDNITATQGISFSISHCPKGSGFAVVDPPMQVGLDLEVADRVKREVIERVSTPEEIQSAPGPAFLWSAKEAAFKSLMGPHQPGVISEVLISQWQQAGPIWFWKAKTKKMDTEKIRGCCAYNDGLMLALASFK